MGEKVKHILVAGHEKKERPKIFEGFYKMAKREGRIVLSFDTSNFFTDYVELAGGIVDDYYYRLEEVEGRSYLYIPIDRFGCDDLAAVMGITDAQKDTLRILYNTAEGEGLKFNDLSDIKTVLEHAINNAATLAPKYGRINMLGRATFVKAIDEFAKKPESNIFKECDYDIDALFDVDIDDGITIIRNHDLAMNNPLFRRVVLWTLKEIDRIYEDESKEANVFILIEKAHAVFEGLNEEFTLRMKDVLEKLSDKGIKVCMASHYLTEIPEVVSSEMECVNDPYEYLTANGFETVREAPGYEYDKEALLARIKASADEYDRMMAEKRANKKKKKKKKSKRAQMLEELQKEKEAAENPPEEEGEEGETEEKKDSGESEDEEQDIAREFGIYL